MINRTFLKEGLRMYRRARHVKRAGFHTLKGTPREICAKIVEDCWDAKREYLRVSTGHFCEFYVRDLAFCTQALIEHGRKDRVVASMRYALNVFERHGKVTQSISPEGVPFSFPTYSPDALALLLHICSLLGDEGAALVREHHDLLQSELHRFAKIVVDASTSLPKRNKQFSGIRDHATRSGACYDAVMVALVAKHAAAFRLIFPFQHHEVVRQMIATYWNGTYFFSDSTQKSVVVGDANVFPFWTGILEHVIERHELAQMREDAMTAIRAAGLDEPFPLRYVSELDTERERKSMKLHIANLFAADYETHSIWMHLGLCYLDVLVDVYPETAQQHIARIGKLIVRHGTFLEVYDTHGAPFRSTFYVTDEGMLWCAKWLTLDAAMSDQQKTNAERAKVTT